MLPANTLGRQWKQFSSGGSCSASASMAPPFGGTGFRDGEVRGAASSFEGKQLSSGGSCSASASMARPFGGTEFRDGEVRGGGMPAPLPPPRQRGTTPRRGARPASALPPLTAPAHSTSATPSLSLIAAVKVKQRKGPDSLWRDHVRGLPRDSPTSFNPKEHSADTLRAFLSAPTCEVSTSSASQPNQPRTTEHRNSDTAPRTRARSRSPRRLASNRQQSPSPEQRIRLTDNQKSPSPDQHPLALPENFEEGVGAYGDVPIYRWLHPAIKANTAPHPPVHRPILAAYPKGAPPPQPAMPVQIIVKNQGKSLVCTFHHKTTVHDLKRQIQEQEGIPPAKQRLLWASNTQLDDDECTIESYGIHKGDTIRLVANRGPRSRGASLSASAAAVAHNTASPRDG